MSKIRDGVAEFELVLGKNKELQGKSGRKKGANPALGRKALGRGLSALMSSSAVQVDTSIGNRSVGNTALAEAPEEGSGTTVAGRSYNAELQDEPLEGGLVYLSIDQLQANPDQPRQRFSEEEIAELSASISRTGLLQPILVRKVSGGAGALASYQIVAGERRYRAAKEAGLTKLPVQVRQLDDREVLEISIVENVQRAQLDPMEEAVAYQRLKVEFGLSQEEIAETVGKDRATVANALRLLKLSSDVQAALIEGKLSAGHARALLGLSNEKAQAAAAKRVLLGGLSVRATEELVRRLSATSNGDVPARKKKPTPGTPAVTQLEERFRRALGTKVQLSLARDGSGELKISFFSEEELEKLLELMNA